MNPANEQATAAATLLLPDKPSALIRLALEDLGKAEKSKRYEVDMRAWHEPSLTRDVCYVCLAGAVMAKTLNTPAKFEREPCDFGGDTERKLFALNYFGLGCVKSGFKEMGLEYPSTLGVFAESVPSYDPANPAPFHASMRSLADWLEKEGF